MQNQIEPTWYARMALKWRETK